jgi:uncharacterized membrane protein YfcA
VDLIVIVIGAGVGVAFGGFGAGGSAFATPLLALAGVPGMAAVASPLPATIPAAVAGAWTYVRDGHVDRNTARDAVVGGVPGTVVGALVAPGVGGPALLVLSALLLVVLGARLLAPARARSAVAAPGLRLQGTGMVVAGAGVGFLTGLLANGGGFLLDPLGPRRHRLGDLGRVRAGTGARRDGGGPTRPPARRCACATPVRRSAPSGRARLPRLARVTRE